MSRPRSRPDWPAVTYEVLRDTATLARVLAACGLTTYLGAVPRSCCRMWPPDYATGPAARLHGFAALNRSLRDAPVLVLLDDTGQQFLVSTWDGAWRSHSGALAGSDLPSLGALFWRCSYSRAARRIARLISLRIPETSGHA